MLSLFGRRRKRVIKISKIGCIYIIKNKINNKVYIGQTSQGIENRWKQHTKPSVIKSKKYAIYRAMNKYGVENFYYEVLEDNIPYEELDNREQYYIEKYDSYKHGYNSTTGGDGKVINKITDVDDIIERLHKGGMVKDIAKDYDVHTYTIRRTLQAYGIHTPSDIQENYTRPDLRVLPREEIKELYLKGKSHAEISNELDIDQRSVSRVVKEFGIGKKKMIDYTSLDFEEILKEYEEQVINGDMKKKDFDEIHGFNQHSIKKIRELKSIKDQKEKSID